jgi:membrane fusion protein (multidrug efflux system)
VESDQASVAALQKQIASREAIATAVKASLDQALLNLSYTRIVAPVSGVVGKKTVEIGQQVEPGQQLLALVPLDDLWVTADFKETQLRRIRLGQRVSIHVDALASNYNGYVEGLAGASGELYSILPPENATGNYIKVVQRFPVQIRFDHGQDPEHRLRPGMSVEPTVWLNEPIRDGR